MSAVQKATRAAGIIPEPREWTRSSVTLPQEVWDRLDTNLKAVNSNRPGPEKFSRDEFIAECLGWAMREIERETSEGRKRGGP
jgi:hypothetical protein